MSVINKILKGDKVIWIIAILLGIISLIAVYSAASALVVRNYSGSTSRMLLKHAFTLLLGYVMMFVAYKIDYKYFSFIFKFVVWLCIPLLLYTMFFGSRLNEASRSFNILGVSFQPSEWAKIALITYLSRELVVLGDKLSEFKTVILKIGLPILIIVGLIFTENLSTALLLLFVCITLLIVGRVPFKHICAIGAIGVAMFGFYILYDVLHTNIVNSKKQAQIEMAANGGAPTQEIKLRKTRVETWISRIKTMKDDGDSGIGGKDGNEMTKKEIEQAEKAKKAIAFDDHHYQRTYAKIAVASSSFFGKGPGKSEQRNFLPHPYSDFIFAIIIEEYGLFGAIIVILLYIIFFSRVMRIVSKRPMTFGAYLSFGLGFLIIVQAMINMGVSVTLLPVTGQPLPFVSMGGTSIMATGFLLGMILSVTRDMEKEEEENIESGLELYTVNTENTDTDEKSTESCD